MELGEDVAKLHHLVSRQFSITPASHHFGHTIDGDAEVAGVRLPHVPHVTEQVFDFVPVQIMSDGVSEDSLESVMLAVV